MKIVAIVYYISGGFLIIFPIILMTVTDEEKLLIFGFVLPGIDYKTSPGYEINIVFQLIQIYYVLTGANVSDSYYVMFLMHARMQLTVIIALIEKLNNLIAKDADKIEIERLFFDIIEKHKSHLRYCLK